MKKTIKKLAAAALSGVMLAAGLLWPAQPSKAAITAWSKSNGKFYNSAGKAIDGAVAKGMDVSVWQGYIDWDKVEASGQIDFAFVRVGHSDIVDAYYKRNLSEANRVGIPVGVYFYSTAKTVAQAQADAKTTINAIKSYKITYPVVIDIEDNSQLSLTTALRTKIVQAFADQVRASGYKPMIYCNTNWAKSYINMNQLTDVDSWIAEWAADYTKSIPRDVWQATDQGSVSGITGNVDLDFAFTTYGSSSSTSKEGWVKSSKGYRYRLSTGKYVKSQFKTINGKIYYFDSSGYRVTGKYTIDGNTYYFKKGGAMGTGWKTINGAKYYFDKTTGIMAKAKWLELKNKWYYFAKGGKMKTGWITLKGKKYYLDSSGVMQTGWQKLDNSWYYFKNSGVMAKNEWLKWQDSWYFLNEDGTMKTGWLDWKGNRYYLKTDGTMRVGWLKYKGKYYYFDSSGSMVRSTTIKIGSKSYTFNSNGVWVK